MNASPVIVRELRAQARNPANYRLRLFAATAALLACAYLTLGWTLSAAELGQKLFGVLNFWLVSFLVIFVPGIAADCLSREKREGTLKLMFLTPLTPPEIVAGKGIVQSLRVLTLMAAMLPVMVVPFLAGGIGWREVFMAVVTDLDIVVLMLTAGVCASAFCEKRMHSVLLAQVISAMALFVTAVVYSMLLQYHSPNEIDGIDTFTGWVRLCFVLITGLDAVWSYLVSSAGTDEWLALVQALIETSIVTLLMAALLCSIAARRTHREWRREPVAVGMAPLVRTFATPVIFKAHFRRKLNRALDRNPIAWLQQHSCGNRTAKWRWCLLVLVVESAMLWMANGYDYDVVTETQAFLLLGLVLGITFISTASFIREKENGVLELILISPVSVRQIIMGRASALWLQALPSLFLIGLVGTISDSEYAGGLQYYRDDLGVTISRSIPLMATTFCALPIVGTYFALRLRKLWSAMVMTWIGVLGLPVLMGAGSVGTWFTGEHYFDPNEWSIAVPFFQIASAVLAYFLLHHSLGRRIYPY